MKTRVGAIVGPTAAGKSGVAVEVADALGAEIVSVDSMQVYVGMDIGTDKASPAMRQRVPHHMLDLWPPSHDVTVSEFQNHARRVIESISGRRRIPLLVGGSGLYYRAVVDDLEFPPRSPDIRSALESEAEEVGPRKLYSRLQELDPDAAARIDPDNSRRVVRALEVIHSTGRRFSENRAWDHYESRYELAAAGVTRPRAELYGRIEQRVHDMLERGLVAEAHRVMKQGMSRTARQALGYRQIAEASNGDVAASIVGATKRFARRQESWFRADPRIEWFDGSAPSCAHSVKTYLSERLRLG